MALAPLAPRTLATPNTTPTTRTGVVTFGTPGGGVLGHSGACQYHMSLLTNDQLSERSCPDDF
jgi:hypothetical protein